VEHDGNAYIGRWWPKRGRRAVVNEKHEEIVAGAAVRVLGVVTLIARLGMWK
jgi:hypothetical protein